MRVAAAPRAIARNVLGAIELTMLRTVRGHFARGGLPPQAERSPDDDARIATCMVIDGLVRVLDVFRSRGANGAAVRLVVREQASAQGALRVELVTDPRAAS